MVFGRPRRNGRLLAPALAPETAEDAIDVTLEATEMTLDADGLGERVIDRVTREAAALGSLIGGAVAAMLRFRLKVPVPMLISSLVAADITDTLSSVLCERSSEVLLVPDE